MRAERNAVVAVALLALSACEGQAVARERCNERGGTLMWLSGDMSSESSWRCVRDTIPNAPRATPTRPEEGAER